MSDQPIRIVIVDDNLEDRLDVKAALLQGSMRRYELHEAETGPAGLDLLQGLAEAGTPADCAILDVHLPGMDAFEVLAALPRRGGLIEVPVVVITGDPRFEHTRALLAAGAQDFVGKGWLGPDSLTRAVDHAMERHALIVESRRLTEKLLHAQKLESLGVMAGGIAHDFNNLLVGILGNAGMVLSELPAGSPVRSEVEAIQTAAIRASELTRQMLAYAGQASFKIGRVDLGALVKEMGQLLWAAVPKSVVLQYELAPDLPAVEGDATQLRQVAMNLLTNAAESIGRRSGVITVVTGVLDADRSFLADTYLGDALPAGRYVTLEVKDTGDGMSEETKKRMFDPFFTTKFTGRGLGLAAVLGILRAHKGAVRVHSEIGAGSTFKILLPATPGAPAVAPTPARPIASTRAPGTILIVDDEEAVRNLIRRVLERAGFGVLIAGDGMEAIESLRQNHDRIQAVVLDMTMPRMSGEETFHALREESPALRVLFTSGYAAQDMACRLPGAGLVGFIEKPFTPQALIDRLKALLEAG